MRRAAMYAPVRAFGNRCCGQEVFGQQSTFMCIISSFLFSKHIQFSCYAPLLKRVANNSGYNGVARDGMLKHAHSRFSILRCRQSEDC